jgi:hypothetical protein
LFLLQNVIYLFGSFLLDNMLIDRFLDMSEWLIALDCPDGGISQRRFYVFFGRSQFGWFCDVVEEERAHDG